MSKDKKLDDLHNIKEDPLVGGISVKTEMFLQASLHLKNNEFPDTSPLLISTSSPIQQGSFNRNTVRVNFLFGHNGKSISTALSLTEIDRLKDFLSKIQTITQSS